MASIIRIKRSSVSGNPGTLGAGELAYSALTDNGSNGGDRLYIGMGTETSGNAANHLVIGGTYFTDKLDHTLGVLTASSAILVDANKKIDDLLIDNLELNGNTLSTTNTNGDLFLTPNGTGKTVITNPYIGDTSTSLAEYIYDTVGGAVTGGTGITISNSDASNTSTVSITNTGVTAGSYGGATAIPVLTINAQGQVTAASTASVASTLNIAGDTGTDGIALLSETMTFTGGEGIDTSVTANTVTISAEDATTTNKGVASFNSASFDVTSGAVSIKAGGVSNSQLANSSVTVGSTTISLGATSTSLAGLTELTVDSLNFNGDAITSTGDINLHAGSGFVVDVNGAIISGVGAPSNPTDAANKAYVDNAVTGLTFKEAVNLLATSNVALTGSTSTLVIDGHAALDSTDNNVYRLLLTGQTTGSQNGIYVYTDNGTSYTLVRATDADTYSELLGASVFVMEGVTYANTGWVQSNHYLTDFTSQQWVQFSGAGAYVAGDGLTQSGTTFNVGAGNGITVNADSVSLSTSVAGAGLTYTTGVLAVGGTTNRITVSADAIDIASTYVGQNTITTLGTIATGTWQGTIVSPTYGGTGVNNGTKTITLGGNLTTSGAFATTLTVTGATTVTLPTTGTLATLAGSETLTNKTITGAVISGGSINNTPIGATTRNTGAFTTLAANGATTLTAGTASTSTSTGTLVVTGGVGISGAIYVGTNITGAGAGTSTLDGFNIDGGTY